MRSYDARFAPRADPELVARLRELPVGSTASVRAIEFRKITPNGWENDFRSGMSSLDVASVIGAAGRVVPANPVH